MTESTYAHAEPDAAAVLAGEGTSITLLDGSTVELRYSFASLRLLEQRFGSLTGLQRQVHLAGNGKPCEAHAIEGKAQPDCDECTPQGAVFSVLADAIIPGLLDARVRHPDTGATIRLGKHPDVCDELLDPGELGPYMKAWAASFGKAMTNLGNLAAAGDAALSDSPGLSGTTQPPSSSGAQTEASG
jgi:hypothetical protein